MFKEISFCTFSRILFSNDVLQMSFNSTEKLPRKWYRNMTFIFKKCVIEKTHLKFYCVYINNASITQKTRCI